VKTGTLLPIFILVLAGSALANPAGSAFAPPGQDEWRDTEDYSRKQLFEEHLVATAPPPTKDAKSKALNGPFTFPANAKKDGNKQRDNAIFGIDVSHWSSVDPGCRAKYNPSREIDFSTLGGQLVRFVYVKATQDVNYRDCRFADYWAELGKLTSISRARRGAYHFLTATSPGASQAASYIRLRQQQGGFTADELPSVLDLEWDKTPTNPDRWIGKSNDTIINSAIAWLSAVAKASGKTPMVYTANSWLKGHHFTTAQLTRLRPYGLWIADYSQTRAAIEKPSVPTGFVPLLWQFTDSSKLTVGPGTELDASVFKGTDTEFARVMQLGG